MGVGAFPRHVLVKSANASVAAATHAWMNDCAVHGSNVGWRNAGWILTVLAIVPAFGLTADCRNCHGFLGLVEAASPTPLSLALALVKVLALALPVLLVLLRSHNLLCS